MEIFLCSCLDGSSMINDPKFVIQVPDTSLHPGSVSFFGNVEGEGQTTQHHFKILSNFSLSHAMIFCQMFLLGS